MPSDLTGRAAVGGPLLCQATVDRDSDARDGAGVAKRFIIYCDESDTKGRFYSHFYGGVLVEASKQQALEEELQNAKDDLRIFNGEMKWQRITEPYKDKYVSFVNTVFDMVERGDMKFRIMFTQNRWVPLLDDFQIDNEYFLLYHQFIKHAFGFAVLHGGRIRSLSRCPPRQGSSQRPEATSV